MKASLKHSLRATLLCAVVAAQVRAQTTEITYQGMFTDNGAPFTGSAEFQFTLWNAASGGQPVATNNPASVTMAVTNGLFTVGLDFGGQVLDEADRFLQIEARTSIGPFIPLTPRQRLTAAPYAVRARSVSSGGLSGGTYANAVTFNNAANNFSGNGAGLTSLNASQLSSGAVPAAVLSNAWKTGGNTGTTPGIHFLGTTDNQPLEFRVNASRVLRLEDNGDSASDPDAIPNGAPNVMGGSPVNLVGPGVVGATISGGGATNFFGFPLPNTVHADYGTISGGAANAIRDNALSSTIGGGYGNAIYTNAFDSAIAGGKLNIIGVDARASTVGGGAGNYIGDNSTNSTIAGGTANVIYPSGSTIAGGSSNGIYGGAFESTIAGGGGHAVGRNAYQSTVGGGLGNTIWDNAAYSTIGGGALNNIGSPQSTIGGGYANFIGTGLSYSTIAGGYFNKIFDGASGTIGGGYQNKVFKGAGDSTIGGGRENIIRTDAYYSTVGGGTGNLIDDGASYATIPGGGNNYIITNCAYAFAAGHYARVGHAKSFVWSSRSAPAPSFMAERFQIHCANGLAVDYGAQRADGGGEKWVVIGAESQFPGQTIATYTGAYLASNGQWVPNSDRNKKTAFSPVDPQTVLEKVVALPVLTWSYTNEAPGIRHLGPMAQDFHAAFGLGQDDKGIGTVDADGVALAAIQGLNQKLEEKLQKKEAEISELKARLEKLEQLLEHGSDGKAR